MTEEERVLQANDRFYQAFEQRSVAEMTALWEHSERAICVHPGWPIIKGWTRIAASWFTLFSNAERLQFIVTNQMPIIGNGLAWVSCEENLMDGTVTSRTSALNLFAHNGHSWLIVAHFAGPVG